MKSCFLFKISEEFKKLAIRFLIFFRYFQGLLLPQINKQKFCFGFLVGEFFHEQLGRFGGYGKTVKTISGHYNKQGKNFLVKTLLSQQFGRMAQVTRFHDTDVIFKPDETKLSLKDYINYSGILRRERIRLFISIDYSITYEYILRAAPTVPIIIWIRDPRGPEELKKLASIPLELETRNMSLEQFMSLEKELQHSLHRAIKLSRVLKRKVIFASNGYFLVERARQAYDLPKMQPYQLPNPMPFLNIKEITFSSKPSLCFIGRLDAQKRFWIVFELAKRFPDVDFYLGGTAQFSDFMDPIVEKNKNIPNVRLIGVVDEKIKAFLLSNCWALLNTSIHEGLPVTFQEAFSYGKPVIASVDPEGLVSKYGYFTGEILGEGVDPVSLDKFSSKIKEFLENKDERIAKGLSAKEYVEHFHTFENFEAHLESILRKEKIR